MRERLRDDATFVTKIMNQKCLVENAKLLILKEWL